MAQGRSQRVAPQVRSGYRRRTAQSGPTARPAAGAAARARRSARRRHRFRQQWHQVRHYLPGAPVWPTRPGLRIPGATGLRSSKLASLAIFFLAVLGMVWMHTDEAFFVYREDVRFTGLSYLQADELYPYGELEGWNALWLAPETIREGFRRHPYVADVQVTIRWPAQVTVQVSEVQPVALWRTTLGDRWLVADGQALEIRSPEIQPPLVFVDAHADATEPGQPPLTRLRPELLDTALRLAQEIPGLAEIRYDRGTGIQFLYPGTATWVQWGDERRFQARLQALQRLQAQIQAEPTRSRWLGLVAPDRPYFRDLAGDPAQAGGTNN